MFIVVYVLLFAVPTEQRQKKNCQNNLTKEKEKTVLS